MLAQLISVLSYNFRQLWAVFDFYVGCKKAADVEKKQKKIKVNIRWNNND